MGTLQPFLIKSTCVEFVNIFADRLQKSLKIPNTSRTFEKTAEKIRAETLRILKNLSSFYILDIKFQLLKYITDHSFKTSANFHDFCFLPPYHRHSSKMLMNEIFDPYLLMHFDLLTIGIWGYPSPPKTC